MVEAVEIEMEVVVVGSVMVLMEHLICVVRVVEVTVAVEMEVLVIVVGIETVWMDVGAVLMVSVTTQGKQLLRVLRGQTKSAGKLLS